MALERVLVDKFDKSFLRTRIKEGYTQNLCRGTRFLQTLKWSPKQIQISQDRVSDIDARFLRLCAKT